MTLADRKTTVLSIVMYNNHTGEKFTLLCLTNFDFFPKLYNISCYILSVKNDGLVHKKEKRQKSKRSSTQKYRNETLTKN